MHRFPPTIAVRIWNLSHRLITSVEDRPHVGVTKAVVLPRRGPVNSTTAMAAEIMITQAVAIATEREVGITNHTTTATMATKEAAHRGRRPDTMGDHELSAVARGSFPNHRICRSIFQRLASRFPCTFFSKVPWLSASDRSSLRVYLCSSNLMVQL
nr:unnamed protein product [Spirometra erinaceieuropaei]